jgi:hypothetical protein
VGLGLRAGVSGVGEARPLGAVACRLHGCPPLSPYHWRNATPWELVPFSHRSASRIFISQPGCPPPPRRRSPETVNTSSWVGRSKTGCDLGPTLSFKDVHHPRWGGGRAEPALYLPRGFVGHPLPRCSKERALTGPAGGTDFDNAGLGDGGRRHLQRVGCVGLAPSGPFCRGAAAAPCAREDRPRCRALLARGYCRRSQGGRRRAARQSSVAPQAHPNRVGLFVPTEGGTGVPFVMALQMSVFCSLWLSGPEHVCNFGTEPCFFLIFEH